MLTESKDPAAYWRKLKQRLKEEGNETVTNCHGLKMTAADGKKRMTDVATTEQLLRIIQSIPYLIKKYIRKKELHNVMWRYHLKEKLSREAGLLVMDAYGFSIKETTASSCVAELMKMYQEMTGKLS